MTICKYGVEVDGDDGHGPVHDTYEEAATEAKRVRGAVIQYEFEYTHSYIVKDFSKEMV